ncbi:MAG TPA: hypothetical protein VL048_06290 [Xanthobacteraceae bacterium]|nr:hypothetical protein [Xanthobacteraceae bacterium]
MKLVTTVAVLGLLLGGTPLALAQSAPTTKISPSPSNINKSSRATLPSGAESRTAAGAGRQHVAGHGKFCAQASPNSLHCYYASLKSCQQHSKANSLHCVTNLEHS